MTHIENDKAKLTSVFLYGDNKKELEDIQIYMKSIGMINTNQSDAIRYSINQMAKKISDGDQA